MGFLFVDRISALDRDSASGALDLPADGGLPSWLIIEAVGQLAAWIAMARSGFTMRPVAAVVSQVHLENTDLCGRGSMHVELHARVDRFDGRAVRYSGSAVCGGSEVANLVRCVGPLLPIDVFDDPVAVRRRFAALCAGGSNATAELPPGPDLQSVSRQPDGARCAVLHIPRTAAYFADHFPRRAVFPATLLADAQNQLAGSVAAEALGVDTGRVRTAGVHDFKVRAFSEPGCELHLAAELVGVCDGLAAVRVSATTDGTRTATGRLDYRVTR